MSRKGFVYDTTSRSTPSSATSPEASLYANVEDDGLLVNGAFDVALSGLSLNTTYYFRAFGYDETDYFWGDELSFNTLNPETFTVDDRTGRKPDVDFVLMTEVTGKGGNQGYAFDLVGISEITFPTNLSVSRYSYWYKDTDTWAWVYKDSTGLYVDNVLNNAYSDIVSVVGGVVTLAGNTNNSVVSDFRVFHRDLTAAQKAKVYNGGVGTTASAVTPEVLFSSKI